MSYKKCNYIGTFVDDVNNTKNETNKLNTETKKINYEIDERINKFKKRFEKLGEQLQSQTLIDYINKDKELNKLVYRVYNILKGIDYKNKN